MSQVSDKVRKDFTEGDNKRDAGLTQPEGILRFDDILYGWDPKWQMLDVYRPKEAGEKELPVIFSVHGGGWVYGDKERYQYYCMDLAMRGFAVVNFTYRLAPENKFPAPLEDINLVVEWMFAHAKEYHLDMEHVFAVGDSAGGHLLGLYSAICTNEDYAKEFAFQVPKQFVPTAVALNCGAYELDMSGNDGGYSTKALMEDFLPEKGSEKECELINVIAHITSKFPPVFCMTATGDFLKEQAQLITAKFVACNVPFLYRFYDNATHNLEHVFHCNMRSVEGKRCNDEECQFFKSFL